jgi:signal transduction histidine kinase
MKKLFPIRFIGSVRFWQAMLETIAFSLVYLLLLLRLTPALSTNSLSIGLLLLNPLCALWCALRIRFASGGRIIQVLREIGLPFAVESIYVLCVLLPLVTLGNGAIGIWRQANDSALFPLFLISICSIGPAYAAVRLGYWVFHFWRKLQRRYLVLSLTNAILSIVLMGGILFSCAILAVGILADPTRGTPGDLSYFGVRMYQWVSFALSLFMGSSLAILCVVAMLLPFAAVFSFWAARRTTRRLTELAGAADQMRKGAYDARVPVQGEDEVARLQAGFNTMAADLERTLKELKMERDRVQGVLHSRKELVIGISHDLRTPVATIRALLESERDAGRPPAADPAALDTMEREVIRLQGLIDELFKVSQAEVDQLVMDPHPIDVGAVVQERVAAVAPLAWQSGRVQVSAEIPLGIPPAIADRTRLEQALANLFHNAIQHTPPGGVVIAGIGVDEQRIRIAVRDTGDGIDSDELPHIWDRYYRGKRDREEGGAGIGLALVKEYIEAMGGSVSVESQPGLGSVFTIFLTCA